MKRSEINGYIREAEEFLGKMNFSLPPFARWSPGEWKTKGKEYDEIRENQLGWDLADFGMGDYSRFGPFLFTLRSGTVRDSRGKPYAEKILIVKPGQVTPWHFHKSKMEDIINRGGGTLKVQVYRSLGDRAPDKESEVPVSVDGRNFTVKAGAVISLGSGESITLCQGIFHQFWSDDATLLLGEVSMVNDDHNDNFFIDAPGRFPAVEEDEKPLRLLVGDY